MSYAFGFQTETYSVENYVCESEVVRRYVVESLGLGDMDSIVDDIAMRYGSARARFYSIVTRCMAWIVAARRRGGPVNLGKLDAAKFVALDDDLQPKLRVTDAEHDRYLETTTGGSAHAAPVLEQNILAVVTEFTSLDPKTWVRGKQELWFTSLFLSRVSDAVRAKGVRAATSVPIAHSNALEILSARCDMPLSLDSFLRTTFARLSETSSGVT
jgi:hypothetical protein